MRFFYEVSFLDRFVVLFFSTCNATNLRGVKIARILIIGAGAVVTKDVEDNTVVIGVPAKKIN